jgi:ATP-dependent DNA ligase
MTKLSDIISMLAAEPSTNAKKQILYSHKNQEDLKKYFHATLYPFYNYFIKVDKLPNGSGINELTTETIDDIVSTLNGRKLTGNAAREYLNKILESLTTNDQVILKNMINRDACCGVGNALVNDCWDNLVPVFPCMKAESYNDKTADNVPDGENAIIAQVKADGGRVQIVVDESNNVSIYSRNGNPVETFGIFDSIFSQYPNFVFDGELLVVDEQGQFKDRKTGNGIFNKSIRGTLSKEEALSFHIVLWDMISYNKWISGYDDTPYETRLKQLMSTSVFDTHRVSMIETEFFSRIVDVLQYNKKNIAMGLEGTMVKPKNMPWENRRSVHMLKLKEIRDATLVCIGVKPHKKHKHLIGSLECESQDGLLEASIGSGLSAADREKSPDYFVGKLIDVLYNEIIDAKTSTKKSMFLPRYTGIRYDQDEADTLEKIINQ